MNMNQGDDVGCKKEWQKKTIFRKKFFFLILNFMFFFFKMDHLFCSSSMSS